MIRIRSLVLGAVTTLTLSACGSDETTGGTGGSGTSSGGSASATGGSATATGGTATGTGGTTSTGGSTAGKGGASSTGGSTATGGSAATTNCQAACTKLKAASCGDLATTNCATDCTPGTACVSEADAYYGCVAATGTVSCNTATMTSRVAGCDTTGRALNVCSVCLADMTDDACDTCAEGSCCMQLQTYVAAADLQGFIDCASADTCDTQACFDGCVTSNPVAGKGYNDLIACERKSCTTPCVCGPSDTDSACTACLKSMCCDLVGPYVSASDFSAFGACIDPCVDQACVDACATQYPIAGAAYEALGTQCVDTTCASDCG